MPICNGQPDDFMRAYIECALWSSPLYDDDGNHIGNLGKYYTMKHFSKQCMAQIVEDCDDFQQAQQVLLRSAYGCSMSYTPQRAGHDFWLSRNRHGAGFWDRGLREIGTALHDAAIIYGPVNLEVNDDREIFAF